MDLNQLGLLINKMCSRLAGVSVLLLSDLSSKNICRAAFSSLLFDTDDSGKEQPRHSQPTMSGKI